MSDRERSDNDTGDHDIDLARYLFARWDQGRGISKSRLEIEVWNDATSHGRHFDRFIQVHLGADTRKPSKQTDRIDQLERQIRGLGGLPIGTKPLEWERQLLHARESCLEAIRIWNDPTSRFRTSAFSLLFVTAWNSLAIAVLQKGKLEWRKLDDISGKPIVLGGIEQSMDTHDLVRIAFPVDDLYTAGLRANVNFWIDLRNCVAHRHLPELDLPVIPQAQAGLMNIERELTEFGSEYALAETLTVPLQLSGFRDPGVLRSRKALQSRLPIDVQKFLDRSDDLPPEVANQPSFQMRIAFVPVVPASGHNPDAIAYFFKPDEVPSELAETLEQYVVLSKITQGAHRFRPSDVVSEVQRRTGFKFDTNLHAEAARRLNARSPKGEPEHTCDIQYALYQTSFKQYQYTQLWIDRLVKECSSEAGYLQTTGKVAVLLTPNG